jgi:ABC-type phosphate transport system substrate-binding protein
MAKKWITVRAGLIGVVALGVVSVTQQSASADPAPTAADVVGVGSDVIQNSVDFLADGDTAGHLGYNSTGNKNRLVNLDATADGNGRNAFTDPLGGPSVPLTPTVVLRAGTSPVQRPNGGGAGLTALVNDGQNKVSANRISFVRSPNLPSTDNQSKALANLNSQLHTVQIADDKQVIATAKITNAPAAISNADLVGIYTGQYLHWNDLPDAPDNASHDAIVPLIPQVGAGVRTIFLNALKSANGGTVPNPTAATPVQQNDPTSITSLSDTQRPNAIVPFPVGRYNLLQSGYFKDPSTTYSVAAPPATLNANGISLEQGAGAFSTDLPYYIVFRESDYASTTPWQPGSSLNWVQTLFFNPGGPKPYVDTPAGQALLAAAGVTPLYVNKGNATAP